MPRIVSLLPSATEWVHALELDGDLVGVTFECDHPPQARRGRAVVVDGLPAARADGTPLSPSEIDARVRHRLAAGEPLYTLDEPALRALAPDVVLTQDLCRVCALPADAVREAVERVGCPSAVVTLDPHRLAEVLDGALDVATACGAEPAGVRVRDRLQARLDAVAAAVPPPGDPRRPRILVLEWTDPPFVAGHWVPDLVEAAGGTPVGGAPGGPGARSVAVSWADLPGAGAVDGVLVAPCGFDLPAARSQAEDLLRGPTPRLPSGVPVWAVDAGAVITRPGPRLVDGVEALAAAWHPGAGVARPDLVAVVRARSAPSPAGARTGNAARPDDAPST